MSALLLEHEVFGDRRVRGRWLGPSASGAGAPSLICFPHAGGLPAMFNGWQQQLGDAAVVVPVLLPGRAPRAAEPTCADLAELVCSIADAMIESGLTGDYALFGHSMGALVAYEVAWELRLRGEPEPFHLFVSCGRAPHLEAPELFADLTDEGLSDLIVRLGMLDGRDAAVAGHYLKPHLPVLRTDLGMCRDYRWLPREPLGAPMTGFAARQDPLVEAAQVDAWRMHTARSFLLRQMPGGHFGLMQAGREPMLRQIRAELEWDRARPGRGNALDGAPRPGREAGALR